MKTEIETRIQISGKRDTGLIGKVNATLAQTDPSDPSETSDSSDSGHRAEPTGPPAPHSQRSPCAPVQNSVASGSPAFPAAAETTPVGRGRSQSEPSPVLFVRRRALIKPHSSVCLHPSSLQDLAGSPSLDEFPINPGSPFARHTSHFSHSTAKYSRTHRNALSRVITGFHALARIKSFRRNAPKPVRIFSSHSNPENLDNFPNFFLPVFPGPFSSGRRAGHAVRFTHHAAPSSLDPVERLRNSRCSSCVMLRNITFYIGK
jgi:hypothetical protein